MNEKQVLYVPPRVRWHPRVWASRFRLRWPFVIWVAAAAGALFLYYHGGKFGGMQGVVEALRQQVAPPELARIQAIPVAVGDEVRAGQPVVQMDTSLLDAELAVERLQIERQFARAVDQAENDLQAAQRAWAAEQGELDVLTAELERMDDLVERRLIDAQTVLRFRSRREALAQSVALYPELIRRLEEALAGARRRAQAVAAGLGGSPEAAPSEPSETDSELRAARQRMGWLNLRREAYTLRAHSDAVVSEILYSPGDVVPAGTPVMILVLKSRPRVIGFLPEANVGDVTVGMKAYVSRMGFGGRSLRAKVVTVSPEVGGLPARIRPFPQQPLRGLRVVLELEEEGDLIPGEGVDIHLRSPGLAWIHNLWGSRSPAPEAGEGL